MARPRKTNTPRSLVAKAAAPESAHAALGRSTRQRSALLAIIAREARPLSPYEVQAVAIPGQPPRYELAEVAAHHHHHFHCRGCDRVYDLEGCPGGLRNLLPRGFTLEEHTIVLAGKCGACAN